MLSALSDACIQASRSSLNLLAQLWIRGSIATFGYFDAHYIFSSTIVLLISSVLHKTQEDQDLLETAWDLLRMMKNAGNVPAGEFLERVTRLKSNIEGFKGSRRKADNPGGSSVNVSRMEVNDLRSTPSLPNGSSSTVSAVSRAIPPSSSGPLDDPLLQSFLMQSDSQFSADTFGSVEELPSWIYDIDFANSLDATLQPNC